MRLNYREATRRPASTFKELMKEERFANAQFIGHSVVTSRLKARGVDVYAAPKSYGNGFKGKLGHIFYAAAINRRCVESVQAMTEEFANL